MILQVALNYAMAKGVVLIPIYIDLYYTPSVSL